MAEALLKIVCENLNSLIQRELRLFRGVKKEMEKLSSTLSTIRAVLEDAEEKQLKDKAIQNWLRKLRDIAYDVDDILDECATEASRLEPEGQSSGLINKVHTSFLTCYHLEKVMFRFKIGKRMREIRERLDEVAVERMRFHLREGVVERRVEAIERRQTCSVVQKLTALVRLDVGGCPELVDLPMGLTSLQHLSMVGCNSFSSISGGPMIPKICSKMVVLPEALQHAPALQSQSICGYSDLASLPDWLGNLTSLQSLDIECCPKLASLPTSVQSLNKLQTLIINDCPELERPCEKESGEDWHKINHRPNVEVSNGLDRGGCAPLKRMASWFFKFKFTQNFSSFLLRVDTSCYGTSR